MSQTNNNTLVPRLRFPEFKDSDEWDVNRLADIGDILQGFGFPDAYQGRASGDYPFIKVSDISNAILKGNFFIKESLNYIDVKDVKDLKAKTIPVGATIFAKIGEAIRLNRRVITGCECLIDNNVAGVKAIEGKAIDNFIYYVLSKIDLIKYSGGTVPSINKTTLENIPVANPNSNGEQQKIAACLTSLDEVITAENQKLEALKAHKKGLLQNLFPQVGQTVPKLRFSEFKDSGEWEEKALEDVALFFKGKGLAKSQINTNDKNPCIHYGELFTKYSEVINEVKSRTNISDGFKSKANDVLMPTSDVTPNGLAKASCIKLNDIILGGDILVIRPKPMILGEFLSRFIRHREQEVLKLVSGTTVFHLYGSSFGKFGLLYPSLPEQQKIADCLSSLDEVIAAQAQKIEALQRHKKGLLQGLFPDVSEISR